MADVLFSTSSPPWQLEKLSENESLTACAARLIVLITAINIG